MPTDPRGAARIAKLLIEARANGRRIGATEIGAGPRDLAAAGQGGQWYI